MILSTRNGAFSLLLCYNEYVNKNNILIEVVNMIGFFQKSIPVRVIPLLVQKNSREQDIKYDIEVKVLPLTWHPISQRDSIAEAIEYVDELEDTLRIKRSGYILKSLKYNKTDLALKTILEDLLK